MCGICVIADARSEPEPGVIERMVATLPHRGPDGSGVKRLPGCHLGHTRLSIIDLETGDQPIGHADSGTWISFNGELYNYRELRDQLEAAGFEFSTTSDTEVVLAAYVHWGSSCLDRFRGMFAFVIWDERRRRMFGARDLFGEKPMYYARDPGGSLLVASELKALVASRRLRLDLSLDALDAFLGLGYVPPDRTVYADVDVLPPGSYFEWDGGDVRVTRYWRPQFDTEQWSMADAAERLRVLLDQAVERQMVADVPVGAFLSGGLDSTSVVALAQQHTTSPLKTFSVGFGDHINELPYARAVADLHNTEHYEVDLGTPAVAELLERMVDVYDEPYADTSNIPTYLLSEFARKQVKVVLTGDGGDELFGGYAWYRPLSASAELRGSRPRWLAARVTSRLLRDRVAWLHNYSVGLGMATRWRDIWARTAAAKVPWRPRERTRMWGHRAGEVMRFVPGTAMRPSVHTTGLNRGFHFDLSCYLHGCILVKVDRAAMAHGLETRAPMLDRDLVEFALNLPANLKVHDGELKAVLKQACKRYWPEELMNRSKQGFGAPCAVWLGFDAVRAQLERVGRAGSPLRHLLPGLRPEHLRPRNYRTWVLLSLGLWLERSGVSV